MMNLPGPDILDELVRDRQERLRPHRGEPVEHGRARVRLGRALIAAGAALSGDRIEPPARRTVSRPI